MLSLSELKPGDTLGRYEILMPVAQGGMASVWAARTIGSRGSQKVVAIKTMLPGLSDDPDFEAMFLDEARLAAKIHHPNVAEIGDFGEEEEWIYLVMEWVNGETIFTLNRAAKTKGGIPLPLLLRLAASTCAGLHAAHEVRDAKGQLVDLVHRDVSPQNVMISERGVVKIVDFGVAKAAGRAHETRVAGIMKGKVPYLSPEQLTGGKVDRRSDIFSLGILLYVMVSGRHPFRGETDGKTMENICTRAPVPLSQLVSGTRPDFEAAVMRALEKSPAARWPTCADLGRALDGVARSLGTPATDADVARFVQSMLADRFRERDAALAEAIAAADARGAPAEEKQTWHKGGSRWTRGGAPLPATFGGIIPVALDEAALPAPAPAEAPARVAPAAVLAAPRRRAAPSLRDVGPYAALAFVASLVLAAVAVRAGRLPWIADRLPSWLAFLAPP